VRLLTKFATRIAAHRAVALLIVGVLVAPAITECAGWSASAAGRHVCCADRGGLAPETSVTDCCAMSEPSSNATAPETQAARTPLKSLGLHFTLVSDSGTSHTPIPAETSRRASGVPLYLRQASLLI
jgi:hypothetical protein